MHHGSNSMALFVQGRAAEETDVHRVCVYLNEKRAMMLHGFGET